MKFAIFVFACLLASVISTPISPKALNAVSGTTTTTTTTSAPIGSTTTVKSTDAPSTVPSETTTVVKDDSTTAVVEVTTATTHKKSTQPSTTTVPLTTTVVAIKKPAPVVLENTKKSPEARKDRGSKKFNMVEKPEEKPVEKPKEEEKPEEKTPEKEPEQKSNEASKDEKPKEKEPEEEEEEKEEKKKPEQKPKESDNDENIPTVSGKIVPAVAQPRILSPEARSKGRKYKDIQIVQLESELEENGKYHFKYENEDGTIVHQSGEMKMMDHDGEKMMGESVEGSYSYKDDDGNTISVTYTADENGFRPVGAHIPTIPPAIARSLAWQATAKPWVDPWVVEQKELRKARKARKISLKSDE